IRAHRFAWEFAYGPIPHGMLVCHRCDNPPCVKAEHLFLGTNLENVRDMMEKGRDWYSVDPSRALKGEEVASSTLTAGEVRQMAEFRKAGIGMRELARIYGVNHGTISRICAGKSWSHVVVAPIECQGLIEARRMWELHATGLSHREISIELGRDKSYVWRVLAGKRWPEAQPVR
ncbi:MAG TPA: HNH endonuclease, partial [Anaeromyxobacteraceae bacterium]|nr:HNH endonuclease [Anaeromyxobacteraceae bacterium]